MKDKGYILYDGPSLLDGAPIVAIATLKTNNRKTGDMVQTWIMRRDVAPTEALKTGADSSVCGQCPHRPAVRRASDAPQPPCYVAVFQAPLNVWKSFHRGLYKPAPAGAFTGRKFRIGSYGDPAAVPFDVWTRALEGTLGHTGYTHQWKDCDKRLARVCMASADSECDAGDAQARGFRTFRIRLASGGTLPREVVCPASDEAGNKLTCAQCGACGGNGAGRRGNVVIIAH